MNIQPGCEQLLEFIETQNRKQQEDPSFEPCTLYPLCGKMLSDFITPIEALKIMKNYSPHVFLLESVQNMETWGRYTFLGVDPVLDITCKDDQMQIGSTRFTCQDPIEVLRDLMKRNRSVRVEGLPPFTGGLVGYFSYDFIHYFEPTIPVTTPTEDSFYDFDLMLFEQVIVFDHLKQTISLIANAHLEDKEVGYHQAALKIDQLGRLLREGKPISQTGGRMTGVMSSQFSQEEFCSMVETARRHIFEGDIFQIVLSNRLSAPFEGSLLDTYRVLRTLNPSPYMFYFSGTDLEAAGASPETLVKIDQGVVHTFPLAGTRPRGMSLEEDLALEQELLHDEKELAEHNMLVDLGRNDLGRICRFGSVQVSSLRQIERYSHVMHIGSTVQGLLSPDKDALDAVGSVLPAGTLSGAPKIRACQLIASLEQEQRGIYGGAVGYLSFTGDLDLCIAIRLAYVKNQKVYVRSGAGIVYDSIGQNEYQECRNKAKAVERALQLAQEMNDDFND